MAVKKDPRMAPPLDSSGPGAYLRKAREDANMTVEKVATALLLHTAIVEALEADEYDRLPAPTFVRGYLRGYARVLGLPSRPVLEMYDRQGFEPPALAPEVTESKQAHTSDAVVRLATYAVAAVLVLLVGLWWNSQEDGGFGISGDLFDWSADSGQDPTATDETGPGPADGEAGDASVAMATDGLETLPQGDDYVPPSPADDALPGGLDATATTPDDGGAEIASGESAPPEPEGSSRDEEVPDTAPSADAATGDTASAQAVQDGASDAPAPIQPGDPAPGEESAVTSPVEDVATGGIVVVDPAPPGATATGGAEDREPSATQEPESRSAAESDVDATVDDGAGADDGAGSDDAAGADDGTGAGDGTRTDDGAGADDGADTDDGAGTDNGAGADDESGVERADGGGTASESDADVAGSGETSAPEGSDGTGAADASAGASLPAAPASETAATTADTETADTEPRTAQSGLVLEFVHESWVEVYDSERNRLFFGLVQPGRVLSFDGPQPYDVLLGFGKDARVAIDGKAFDHTPYLKHGVGRFSVGSGPDTDADAGESAGAAAPGVESSQRNSRRQDDGG